MDDTAAVAWSEWSDEAFRRAAGAEKPILLSIVVSWCDACREMDRTSFADRAVARLIAERFVPVRVDAERRPDIGDRYSLGGWPTTALLTPGGEVLAGATFVPATPLATLLSGVSHAFETRRGEVEARAGRMARRSLGAPRVPSDVDTEALVWIAEQIAADFDAEHGGFGRGLKEPHAAALLFAVERAAQTGDVGLRRIALDSLDVLDRLFDPVEGGFHRYCAQRDWSLPHTEKLLEQQASLLLLDLKAWEVWRPPRARDRAWRLIQYVDATLADAEGGFHASQAADEAYYALGALERQGAVPPTVDRTMYTDANARMISAYLAAAAALDSQAPGEFAVSALERVLLATYERGAGLAHWPGGVRGLLADQIAMSAALLDAFRFCERDVYADFARELMYTALRTLWDEEYGGFFDRAPTGIGRLAEPLKPLAVNCEAAEVLARLAALTGEGGLRRRAAETLAALAPEYRSYGIAGACYARAVAELGRVTPTP